MIFYINKKTKRLGKAVVESEACYGCEVWILKREEQRKLITLEMDYLRSVVVFRLQKISTPGAGCKEN